MFDKREIASNIAEAGDSDPKVISTVRVFLVVFFVFLADASALA